MPNLFDKNVCYSLWKPGTLKRIEAEKNCEKDGKALYKLMNNAIYGKTMKNLGNGISVKL